MLKFYPELLQEEINFVNCDGTEFIDTWHVRGESRYARWATPDPLADKYYSTSPYAFCNNNPVNFVDPDGRSTWVIAKPDGTYTIEGGDLYDNDLNMVICRNVKQDHLVMRNIGDGKEVKITDI